MTDGGMVARTALVTGANSGIGLATARGLAAQGFRVVMLCRDPVRGAEAVEDVIATTKGRAELLVCDLSDPHQIAGAAAELGARLSHLDVLVNNAGLYAPRRRETPDGLEQTFAVNHLGPFRLTLRLMTLLRKAPAARVVNLASRSHKEAALDLDDLQRTRRPYNGYAAYADSKLCNLLFTSELARRLDGTQVTTTAVHPGVIATGFAQDEPGWLHSLYMVGRWFMPGPERGADSVVWLASAPEPARWNGVYVVRRRVRTPSPQASNAQTAAALWAISETLSPGVPTLRPRQRDPAGPPPPGQSPSGRPGRT